MDITPFVDSLRRDLLASAQAASPEAQPAVERLLVALEPAARLALLEVLSQAAAEITAELPTGVVEVRLRGRDPELVVDVPAPAPPTSMPRPPVPPEPAAPPGPPRAPGEEEVDGDVADTDDADPSTIARITLRIPESVKARAEQLAASSGYSLNSWVVGVLRAATSRRAVEVDLDLDLSSIPMGGTRSSRRLSGWI